MGLRNMKIPKMKFNKMKINLDELNKIDYEKLERKNMKHRTKPYEDMTNYKTVKEFFFESVNKYPDKPCILEKPNHKEPYKVTTYKEFYEDVIALGTALTNILNLKDKRVIIIGETRIWVVCFIYGNALWSWNSCSNR